MDDAPDITVFAAQTPCCLGCGVPLDLQDEAIMMLRGNWMPLQDRGVTVFVLDPNTVLEIISLPNGQLALRSDHAEPTQHSHLDCMEQLLAENLDGDDDDE